MHLDLLVYPTERQSGSDSTWQSRLLRSDCLCSESTLINVQSPLAQHVDTGQLIHRVLPSSHSTSTDSLCQYKSSWNRVKFDWLINFRHGKTTGYFAQCLIRACFNGSGKPRNSPVIKTTTSRLRVITISIIASRHGVRRRDSSQPAVNN